MSNRPIKRAKSPATRNRFNDIGIHGRKTGVRVAGKVRIDEDGLENVDEFYKQTSPSVDRGSGKKKAIAAGLQGHHSSHPLLSPSPVKTIGKYDTLMGAFDLPDTDKETEEEGQAADVEDESMASPIQPSSHQQLQPEQVTPVRFTNRKIGDSASRRTTMAAAVENQSLVEPDWVKSSRKMKQQTKNTRSTTILQTPRKELAGKQGRGEEEEEGEVEQEQVPFESDKESTPVNNGLSEDGRDGNILAFDDLQPGDYRDGSPEKFIDDAGGYEEDYSQDQDQEHEHVSHGDDMDEVPDAHIDEDDDEDEDYPDVTASAHPPEEEEEEEMEELAEPEPTSLPKRGRGRPKKNAAAAAPKKNGSKAKEHVAEEGVDADEEHPIRRSTRASVQPLAFWRNEHIEYEYGNEAGDKGDVAVPKVKNVVRVRQTAEEKGRAKKRRMRTVAGNLASLRDIKLDEIDLNDRGRFYYYDDENYGFPVNGDSSCKYGPKFNKSTMLKEGEVPKKWSKAKFDDNDDIPVDERPKLVISSDGVEEQLREIAVSRQSIVWADMNTKRDNYRVGYGVFAEDPDGMIQASSGVLSMAVGSKKPARNSNNKNTFYLVTSGQVEVHVHSSRFRVGVLGQFLVPAFNVYAISNVGTHPAQLFYVQACVPMEGEEEEEEEEEEIGGERMDEVLSEDDRAGVEYT